MLIRDDNRDLKFLEDDIKWNENRKNEVKSKVLSNLNGNSILNGSQKKSKYVGCTFPYQQS
ncbi:hypothetical protein CHH58_13370 [Terribacillus saccharophilus]|nr:hypothetical protein CHH58_13370 [Terribacillus saccharophilus]